MNPDEIANLTLTLLRRVDAKVDKLQDDMDEMKARVSTLEESVTRMQRSLDRFDIRLRTIERRLDLIDEPAAPA